MKTEITLIRYIDPGHSWVRVPLKTLAKLGVANLITPFSYVRTIYAYLEEDVDFTTFKQAFEAKGKTIKFVDRHTNRQSRIRQYDNYGFIQPVSVPETVIVKSTLGVVTEQTEQTQAETVSE